jgi:hypothetical protein
VNISQPVGLSLQHHHRCIFAIIGGSIDSLVEWYDFYIYSFGSLYFAPVFFPTQDRTSQLLAAAGVFAARFLMRSRAAGCSDASPTRAAGGPRILSVLRKKIKQSTI